VLPIGRDNDGSVCRISLSPIRDSVQPLQSFLRHGSSRPEGLYSARVIGQQAVRAEFVRDHRDLPCESDGPQGPQTRGYQSRRRFALAPTAVWLSVDVAQLSQSQQRHPLRDRVTAALQWADISELTSPLPSFDRPEAAPGQEIGRPISVLGRLAVPH
jgi:hypothetical protein